MCEINPKHTKVFRLEFFTSQAMGQENFEQLVAGMALGMEMKANESGIVRCHVHEMREQINEAVDAITDEELDQFCFDIWPGDNPENNALTRVRANLKRVLAEKMKV